MAGALSATATLYGCSGSGSGGSSSPAVVNVGDNLVFDKTMITVMGSEPWNCGGKCMFKYHVKNGRMLKVTGGQADIPRATSTAADESIDQPQFRPCIRGYGQLKKNYQPDRLKYPMKQTKSRGDLTGFVRISWAEAFDTLATWYKAMVARSAILGYLPVCSVSGAGANISIAQYMGVYNVPTGAPSTDNLSQAQYGSTGSGVNGNSLGDMLNSKFIFNIGCNSTVSFSHQYPIHWYLTKAKEAGIPIITMDPLFTDSASTLSTGYSKYNLPAYINSRAGTDGAILAAMANVIYRKNLHDVAFITQYCFGFFPGDTVVSQSTQKNPITKVLNTGLTFTTPTGMSFVEYLDDLQAKNGGYNGVLAWASQISGVSATIIENLGIAYGTTKPAWLMGGYGGCRSAAAYQYSMLLVALSCMTGNANKTGGGIGYVSAADPTPVSLGATKEVATTAATFGSFSTSSNAIANLIMNGTDNRSFAQLKADLLALNNIDLGTFKAVRDDVNGKDGRLRIEMIEWGGNNFNQRRGNINKMLIASKNVKYTWALDTAMNPSAVISDLVLPMDTHLERDEFQSKNQVYFFNNKVVEPMFEAKGLEEMKAEILNRMGIKYGIYGPRGAKTPRVLMSEQWAGATINATLLAITPAAKLPDFETFSQQGVFQLPLPASKSVLGFATLTAGKFNTDTGKINFFSPFYFNRDKGLVGGGVQKADGGYYRSVNPPKAMFAPPLEGFDQVTGAFLGYYDGNKIKNGVKVRYTLQIDTAHHRRRQHSVSDDVAILKENFPGVMSLNTADAAARGISDGDEAYAFNDRGCVKVKVTVSKRVSMGTIHIADGEWYRPSLTEKYDAWLEMNNDGVFARYIVPVDVGGAPNTLMHDRDVGVRDYSSGTAGDNCWNGHFVEVSKTHPDL